MRRSIFACLIGLAAFGSCAATPAPPVHESVRIVTDRPFIAEGIAVDGQGRLLVSGVAGHTIRRLDCAGGRPWLRPGRFAPIGGLFGMAADPARNRLWIAETFGADVPGGTGPRRTGLLEVSLHDGRVLARHEVAVGGSDRWIGDVAVGRNGTVYASDSKGGGIYLMRPRETQLRLIPTRLKSPQGLVERENGKALLVLDYASGLHRIDLETAHDELMKGGARRGLDGLARFGRDLVATYNGAQPNALLRLTLDEDEQQVTNVLPLAQDSKALDDVSLLTAYGGRLFVIGHSQWGEVGKDNRLHDQKPARVITLAP